MVEKVEIIKILGNFAARNLKREARRRRKKSFRFPTKTANKKYHPKRRLTVAKRNINNPATLPINMVLIFS